MTADTVRTRIYGGGSKGDAIRDFTADAAEARSAGWIPFGQEWRDGPVGRVLVVTYVPEGTQRLDGRPWTGWGPSIPSGAQPLGWTAFPGPQGAWPPFPAGWSYGLPVPPPSRWRHVAIALAVVGVVASAAGLALVSGHRVRGDPQYDGGLGLFSLGLAMLSAAPALAGMARRKARQPAGWLGRLGMIALFCVVSAFWVLAAVGSFAGPPRHGVGAVGQERFPVVSPISGARMAAATCTERGTALAEGEVTGEPADETGAWSIDVGPRHVDRGFEGCRT